MNSRPPIATCAWSSMACPVGLPTSRGHRATLTARVAWFFCIALAGSASVHGQEEPSRLRYTVPNNWAQAGDGQTLLPPGPNVAVTFGPSTPFDGTAEQWMDHYWRALATQVRFASEPVTAANGRFLARIAAFEQAGGSPAWLCLHTLVQNGRGESVIFIAGTEAEFGRHMPALRELLAGIDVGAAPARQERPAPATAGFESRATQPEAKTTMTLADYEFVPPTGWQVQKKPDHILLTQGPDQSGCVIQILPPQPSSGNLEQDAAALFELMYPQWGYARQGEQQYVLSRGRLPSGFEFAMKEAQRNATDAHGRYLLEDGVALVVKTGSQVALIAVRHRGVLAHNDCQNRYDTWRRFFNSFAVKGATPTTPVAEEAADRIVGVWSQSGGGAIGEYAFAANGHFAIGGGLGSSSTTRDDRYEHLHIRSHAWSGDGTYTISGNELSLRGRGTNDAERVHFRIEQVNHGGTGWKDRLWLLKTDRHGLNEVAYDRKGDPPPRSPEAPAVSAESPRPPPPHSPVLRPTSSPEAPPANPPRTVTPPITPSPEAPAATQRLAGVFLSRGDKPDVRPWILLFGGDGRIAVEGFQHVLADPACPPRGKGTYEIRDGNLTLKLEGGYTRTLPIQLEGNDPLKPRRIVLNRVVFEPERTPPAPLSPASTP